MLDPRLLLQRTIPDRNLLSPVWVEHEINGHIHLLVCAHDILPEDMATVMAGIEGYGEELAEDVMRCNEDRHEGHGITHTYEDAKAAYGSAVSQLITRDFQAEWAEIQRKQHVYERWGGQVPRVLFQPMIDNHAKWEMLVTDSEGTPYSFGVKKGVFDDWNPKELGAKPNGYGRNGLGGWTLPEGKN